MDPWATSRTLLQWRDRLVELGWKPDGGWQSRRLADLAAAEGAAADLPPGIADRTTALLQVLETAVSPPVRRVRLIDRRDIHPSRTRQRSEEHTSELQSLMRISYAVFCLK